MRLLIVEDEKQICDMVAKSLYGVGYENSDGKMRRQRLLYYLQEDRSRIRLRDWMQVQMIIWKNHFI